MGNKSSKSKIQESPDEIIDMRNGSLYIKRTDNMKYDLNQLNEQPSRSEKLAAQSMKINREVLTSLKVKAQEGFDDLASVSSEIVMSSRCKFDTIDNYRAKCTNTFAYPTEKVEPTINSSSNLRSSVAEILGKVSKVMKKKNFNEEERDLSMPSLKRESSLVSKDKDCFSTIKDSYFEAKSDRLFSNREELVKRSKKSKKNSEIGKIDNSESSKIILAGDEEAQTTSSTESNIDDNRSVMSSISIGNQSLMSRNTLLCLNPSIYEECDLKLNTGDYKANLLRREYIMMLMKNKIWIPGSKAVNFNSIIIFDWDDTLFCTSYLTPHGVFEEDTELSDQDLELIAKLEFCVLRLLTLCIESNSDIYIVTNSEEGWVEYSARRYLPSIYKLLSQVTIISARAKYGVAFPNDSKRWKIESFLAIRHKYKDVPTNLINIGDSLFDVEAGTVLCKQFKEAYLKSVKFRECPTLPEMIKQLNLIISKFAVIHKSIKTMTVRVEKK